MNPFASSILTIALGIFVGAILVGAFNALISDFQIGF